MAETRILVADDEPTVLQLCLRLLRQRGYEVQGVSSGQEALSCLETQPFDLLVVDIKMPDVDGITVFRRGRELDPDLSAVVITGYASMENAIEALHAGARAFVLKPFRIAEFLAVVEEALAQRENEQERLRLRAQLPILEIAQALLVEGDPGLLAQKCLEAVEHGLGADRAMLFLLDAGEGTLHAVGAVGAAGAAAGDTLPIETTLVAQLSQMSQPLAISLDTEGQTLWRALVEWLGTPRAIIAPLRTVKECIGLLCLGRSKGGVPFTASDLNLLAIVGGQIATALENTRLYEEVRTTRDYFRAVHDCLYEEVIVIDRNYVIADANQAFCTKVGKSYAEVVGQPCYRLTHQVDAPCTGSLHVCPVAQVLATSRPAQSRHVHYEQGQIAYVSAIASPLRDARGEISQVVVAYRDVTEERRLQEKLAAIHALGRELVLLCAEEPIARAVMEAAQQVLALGICNLWLIDEEQGTLDCRAMLLPDEQEPPSPLPTLPLVEERSIVAAVARSGQLLYLPDVGQDPRYFDAGLGSRSELCVPLRVGERVIGILNAESQQADAFGEDDQQLFATLADQAALAIENARLLAETRQRLQQVRTLLEVSRDVVTQLDLSRLLQSILEAAVRSVPAGERGSILLLDPVAQELIVAAHIGYAEMVRQQIHLGLAESFAGWVCREGRADIVVDTHTDPRFAATETTREVRSMMSAPLIGRNGLVGVINLDNLSKTGAFDQKGLDFLSGLADQAALAIENARLYEVVARGKREWEATFDAIAAGISLHDSSFRIIRANQALAGAYGVHPQDIVGQHCCQILCRRDRPAPDCPCFQAMASGEEIHAQWEIPALEGIFLVSAYPLLEAGQVRGVVRVQQDITAQKRLEAELVRSEKLAALGRLVASLAHEINNPLQALRSGLRLMVNRRVEEEKRQQYLRVANREVERLITIVERVLGFYRPSGERPAPTDINATLDETLTLAGKRLEHGGVVVYRQFAPDLPLVQAHADQLKQVFLNIILNALQSMPGGGQLVVETGHREGWDEVYISFTDTGGGISADVMAHLFEPFHTTRAEGTGLGLAISYGLIERHGGRIEVQTEVGVGSTFTILLPVQEPAP